MRLLCSLLTLFLCLAQPLAAADRPPIVASAGGAFVAHRTGSDAWTIGSEDLEVAIGFDASRTLAIESISNPATGRAWDITPQADTDVTANGETITLSASGATTLVSTDARTTGRGVVLTFVFEHRARAIRISRSYACYGGSPTIETWTRIEATSGSADISNLIAWRLTMPNARVRWLGGLRGDSADNEEAGAFALADRDLDPGERIEIGSDRQ